VELCAGSSPWPDTKPEGEHPSHTHSMARGFDFFFFETGSHYVAQVDQANLEITALCPTYKVWGLRKIQIYHTCILLTQYIHTYLHTYILMYVYMERETERERPKCFSSTLNIFFIFI
jgi:hypothetical protein